MSQPRLGLSDPFKPKNDTSAKNHDLNEYMKTKNMPYVIKDTDNLLTRMVKKIIRPKSLNLQFRERFNLNNDYKLVYWIQNESLILTCFVLINFMFPIFLLFIGVLGYAEATGGSQLSKSFESPHEAMAMIILWLGTVLFIARKNQKITVFRIYYNEKEDKFALIRMRRLLKFEKEDFKSENVKYRFDNKLDTKSAQLVKSITKNLGNTYINKDIKNIDYKLFSDHTVLKKFLGPSSYDYLKSKKIF